MCWWFWVSDDDDEDGDSNGDGVDGDSDDDDDTDGDDDDGDSDDDDAEGGDGVHGGSDDDDDAEPMMVKAKTNSTKTLRWPLCSHLTSITVQWYFLNPAIFTDLILLEGMSTTWKINKSSSEEF